MNVIPYYLNRGVEAIENVLRGRFILILLNFNFCNFFGWTSKLLKVNFHYSTKNFNLNRHIFIKKLFLSMKQTEPTKFSQTTSHQHKHDDISFKIKIIFFTYTTMFSCLWSHQKSEKLKFEGIFFEWLCTYITLLMGIIRVLLKTIQKCKKIFI